MCVYIYIYVYMLFGAPGAELSGPRLLGPFSGAFGGARRSVVQHAPQLRRLQAGNSNTY